ncbi:MAG: 16S rRNA processing protein RimM [Flavobacteriales bacterium]|nr:16S rRNA processing protein RimM [Flavobacteriales bacterium]
MSKEDYSLLGRFAKTHGIKGEIVLKRDDLAFDFSVPDFIYIEINGLYVPYCISTILSKDKGFDIIQLEDLETIDDANLLLGANIFIPTTDELATSYDDSNPKSLITFEVIDEREGFIGNVSSILETKGQNILQIEFEGKEILIPHTEEIVTNIDRKNKRIDIEAPEGLIGLYI